MTDVSNAQQTQSGEKDGEEKQTPPPPPPPPPQK
jgi:hypothetical protein